jgi:nucleotidyltransferase substrate binding protein (TIGR01987 family)
MDKMKDIRWKQRFANFNKALIQLENFVQKQELNELEKQGLIKAFEYTYELAWKTLQDLLKEKGFEDSIGPKPVIDQSFQIGYIESGEGWVKMHKSRNLSAHTYDQIIADEIIVNIKKEYIYLFKELKIKLEKENNLQKSLFD